MSKFDKPVVVQPLDLAFGGDTDKLMPAYKDIPAEFKSSSNYWANWQSKWFFDGLKPEDMPTPKPGIDLDTAMRHLGAINRSFEPKHEHKQAGVAYLASLWFETP